MQWRGTATRESDDTVRNIPKSEKIWEQIVCHWHELLELQSFHDSNKKHTYINHTPEEDEEDDGETSRNST